jgi:hypothetical protein
MGSREVEFPGQADSAPLSMRGQLRNSPSAIMFIRRPGMLQRRKKGPFESRRKKAGPRAAIGFTDGLRAYQSGGMG